MVTKCIMSFAAYYFFLFLNIYTFADDIISKFFAAAELNPYLFASVLFWKTRVDCLMINGGYSVGDSSDDERYANYSGWFLIVASV